MRALFSRYAPHLGLIVTRTAAVLLFCIAGTVFADLYLPFEVALGLGVPAGAGLGMVADFTAVAYGKRIGRQEIQDHQARQETNRRNARQADTTPGHRFHRNERPGVAAAAIASARTGTHRSAEGGSRLVDDTDRAGADTTVLTMLRDDAEAAALNVLRGMMNDTLKPHELVGQQGRGVITLAGGLGRLVPILAPETVTAYVSDHMLVAAGLAPEHAEQWPAGLLDGVTRLETPAGEPPLDGAALERVDGLDRIVGADLPDMLDTIVEVVALSGRGDGLFLAQISVCLDAKGYRVGPFTLAVACSRLITQGRLVKSAGSNAYRLAVDDGERRAGPVSPDLVFAVLADGPVEGMTGPEVVAEVTRRRGFPVPSVVVYGVLGKLRVDRGGGLVVRAGVNDRWRLAEPNAAQVLAGPGLSQHVFDVVTEADPAGGIGFDRLLVAVQGRPGFASTTAQDLHNVLRSLTAAQVLVDLGDAGSSSYRLPPF